MKKLVYRKKWSSDGWDVTAKSGDKYKMSLFLGKVSHEGMEGNLLVIGNLYIVWQWV